LDDARISLSESFARRSGHAEDIGGFNVVTLVACQIHSALDMERSSTLDSELFLSMRASRRARDDEGR
jgi:hypothetical protein